IDHDFIEQSGRILENLPDLVLGTGVSVTGDGVPAGGTLADPGSCDASRDREALGPKAVPCPLKKLPRSTVAIAKALDVNFDHARLLAPAERCFDCVLGRQTVPHILGGNKG